MKLMAVLKWIEDDLFREPGTSNSSEALELMIAIVKSGLLVVGAVATVLLGIFLGRLLAS